MPAPAPEVVLARCAVCRFRMDPVLPLHGYRTHPCCQPGEVSPRWEPGDTPLRGPKRKTAHRAQRANGPPPTTGTEPARVITAAGTVAG